MTGTVSKWNGETRVHDALCSIFEELYGRSDREVVIEGGKMFLQYERVMI